ncbi:MAG: hypothetical protein CBD16_03875 [Betaproteobacteria bacterium TMED156]|nr:MAG: hypothetical protein CBD16_03875 [Betaproteobacteria bacterium TMED156]
MIKKKFVLGTFLILISAAVSSLTLNYYDCPNKESAVNCSEICSLAGTIEFSATPKSNSKKIYFVEKIQNNSISDNFENCEIKDITNWECISEKIFSSSSSYMIDGKFFSATIYRMLDGKDDKRFSCAIK